MASSRLPHGALHGPSDVAEATAEAVGEEMVPRTHAGGARSFGGAASARTRMERPQEQRGSHCSGA